MTDKTPCDCDTSDYWKRSYDASQLSIEEWRTATKQMREELDALTLERDNAIALLTDLAEARARVAMLVDMLETARFRCVMLAGRTTYSPEQFDNTRYVCAATAEDIKKTLSSSPTDALDAIREAQEVLSKMSGIPSAQEALQKLNAVFGEVGNG